MNKIKFLSSILLLSITASFSSAQELDYKNTQAWNQHTGPFAELTFGTNAYFWGILSSQGHTGGSGTVGSGRSGALGYHFTPSFALEGGLIQSFVTINDHADLDTPYVTTRFTLPLGDNISLIGKLGLMFPYIPKTGGFLLPFTGIGASYALSEHVDATIQYQGGFYGIAAAGLLGVGLTYHLG